MDDIYTHKPKWSTLSINQPTTTSLHTRDRQSNPIILITQDSLKKKPSQ